MADITMCDNGRCKCHKCYRRTATPSRYQSYANFKLRADGYCNYFFIRNGKLPTCEECKCPAETKLCGMYNSSR